MVHSFFQSKKRLVVLSSLTLASAMTMLFFQNCAGSKVGASNQVGVSASSVDPASDPVSKNMDTGVNGASDIPVGSIGGAGSISDFKNTLLPGFTISKTEITSIQSQNADTSNTNVVCKLFARPTIEIGQTAAFMIVMFDSTGKENFDSYKDVAGNFFKFPVGGSSHIDLIGYNKVGTVDAVGIRQRLPQESQRLGHAVYTVSDASKAGVYTRVAEVFGEDGKLLCRTNQVSVTVLNEGEHINRIASTSCLAKDVSPLSTEVSTTKLCSGFRVGFGFDQIVNSGKIAATEAFGSQESNAQSSSRLQAAQFCNSGRALVSRIQRIDSTSVFVENECLK